MKHRNAAGAIGALLLCGFLAVALPRPARGLQDAPTPSPSAEATPVSAEPTEDPASTAPPPTPVPAPPITDWRFGVIESYEAPDMATRLGAAWTRVRFQWAETQPNGPDDWEPAVSEEQIAAERDAGREVVGLLIGIPDWARDRADLPRGLYLPDDDPDNTWAVFVREVVGRYAGQIDHWVIWNEPDIDDPDALGHTWDGTVSDFAQLQQVAFRVARETNPDAVIHLAAVTHYWNPDYLGELLDALGAAPDAADNNHYFDIATAHLYFQPNSVFDVLSIFRQTLDARGLKQPIWLVETNAPPIDDPYWPVPNWTLSVTLYEQAAYVPQVLAAALAAGAERIAVFKLMDTAEDRAANPEPFGLVRVDTSRRPAFDTYRVAIGRLGGANRATRERWDAIGQIRLDQDDRTTTVIFSRLPSPQTATVRAIAPTADLYDMWGKRQTIEAEDAVFTVELTGAICTQTIGDYCMIGGTVYYLVQDADAETLDELPTGDLAATPVPAAPTPRPSAPPISTRAPQPASTAAEPASDPVPLDPTEPPLAAEEAAALPVAPAQPEPAQPAVEARSGIFDYVGLLFLGLAALVAVGALAGWRRGK